VSLRLYNTLTRKKAEFIPHKIDDVRMYVCGPTVYDHAHIGNARPVIVFDMLYRLLRHLYGEDHVTYARNITDVDDKIIVRARKDFPYLPLNEAIAQVTEVTKLQFHTDIAALGCLAPSEEPHATQHIPEMIKMIEQLVASQHAYSADGHVLFSVNSFSEYGRLSGRSTDEMIAGARVEIAPYKEDAMDFVLWKPSAVDEPGWDSPWGRGRPGWHIECSAMSAALFGETFDVHGGGVDLVFPHHENEVAQSCCAHGTDHMAQVWMHNGFLQVEGRKMSKSVGNFVTIHDLLETDRFGGRPWPGEALRLAMLMTHYRQPIDWTVKHLQEALLTLDRWYSLVGETDAGDAPVDEAFRTFLCDDLNTPAAISRLHMMNRMIKGPISDDLQLDLKKQFKSSAKLIGLFGGDARSWFGLERPLNDLIVGGSSVEDLVDARDAARAAKNFVEADRIRVELADSGIVLKDGPDGTTWEIAR